MERDPEIIPEHDLQQERPQQERPQQKRREENSSKAEISEESDAASLHPMAVAMQWVGRVFGVVAMMAVPGMAGNWLDRQLGTNILALVGLLLGLMVGMSYLIAVTRRDRPYR
jgi:hypothetical protein